MKMGVMYVLVVAAVLLYGVMTGNYDIPTAWKQLKQFWQGLEGCNYM